VPIIFVCGYVKFNIPHKGDDLRLTICAYYSWEMASDVSLGVSFHNIWYLVGIGEEAEEVRRTKAYVKNDPQ
jgi:hypothetical protein